MAETTCSHLQLQFAPAVLNSQAPSLPSLEMYECLMQ